MHLKFVNAVLAALDRELYRPVADHSMEVDREEVGGAELAFSLDEDFFIDDHLKRLRHGIVEELDVEMFVESLRKHQVAINSERRLHVN